MWRAMAIVGANEGCFEGAEAVGRGEGGGAKGERDYFCGFIKFFCFLFQFSPSGRVAERFAKQVQFCKSAEVGTGWGRGG